jgi:hypothetical protein
MNIIPIIQVHKYDYNSLSRALTIIRQGYFLGIIFDYLVVCVCLFVYLFVTITTSHISTLTGLQLWPQHWGHFLGSFLGGHISLKIGVSAPLDRESMPVQKYVPSYLTKLNPIWFK